ncbi:hypothetical protein [Auritidibacter ignavus]|nr:hypothetical protein [Auritidibacter ignavus]WHS29280.1 hypothetical protein QM395_06095 [Auritidibacter ignavus]
MGLGDKLNDLKNQHGDKINGAVDKAQDKFLGDDNNNDDKKDDKKK